MKDNIVIPDFLEAGSGHKVVLFHSSVAGAKQWRSLMEALEDRYHLIAINLYGYGETEAWSGHELQTLEDQAKLIQSFLNENSRKISIVGHSFGGSVAMKAAAMFKDQVHRLVLIEPNPFYLLNQHKRVAAYQEAVRLRDVIKSNGEKGTWEIAAEMFANYWTGDGSWESMPDRRKLKFAESLKPNFHEWDAVMNESTKLSQWAIDLPEKTTVISANDTVQSIGEIVTLMENNTTNWNYQRIERGGHMAIMNHPETLNPIVERALE